MVAIYKSGNIVNDQASLLVNTVNTVGIMGKGVALAFKNRWPSIVAPYQKACREKTLKPGDCLLFDLPDGRKWAALATKGHWRYPSQQQWIESGLKSLADQARSIGLKTIAIPPPGCGNGGLDWEVIEPIVLDVLHDFDLNIYGETTLNYISSKKL